MCNLSVGIERRAIEKGRLEGRQEGRQEGRLIAVICPGNEYQIRKAFSGG